MSVKILNNLHKFEKTNKKYKNFVRYSFFFGLAFVFLSLILHYKSKILGVILNSRDYGVKIKNVHISDTLNAVDASIIMFDKDVDISIKAGNVSPDNENSASNLKDISAVLTFKKDGRHFFAKSLHGSIKKDKTISLYPNPVIIDEEKNSANFSHVLFDTKLGIITGKLPIIEGKKGEYSYNISGSLGVYGKRRSEIDISGPVNIKIKNLVTKEEAVAFGESGLISIDKRIFLLKKNVKIERLKAVLTTDLAKIFFFNKNQSSKTEEKLEKRDKVFSSDVEKIEFIGNVHLFDSEQDIKVWCDFGEYESNTGDMSFSKNVKAVQTGKEVFASKVIYNLETKKFKIISSSNSSLSDTSSNKSRVKIVFN